MPIQIKNFDVPSKHIDKRNEGLDPMLPKIPFSICLVGASNSGKTTLLLNLLEQYSDKFRAQDVILISPSIDLDDKLDMINCKWKYNKFNEEVIDSTVDQQKNIKKFEPNKLPNLLVILDDCLQTGAFNHHGVIETAFVRLRHYNISLICTSQKYSGLSRTIRLNCKSLIIFEPYNMSEFDHILDENSDKYTRKKYKAMMDHVFSKPFAFLLINNTERDKSKRYIDSFQNYLNLNDF